MPETKSNSENESDAISKNTLSTFSYVFLVVIAGMVVFNQLQINSISTALASASLATTGDSSLSGNASNTSTISTGSAGALQLSDVLPKGVPAVYGAELGVSYDDVSPSNQAKANETIAKLSVYDTGITLSGEKLQRYIDTVLQISCEYCCGAESIIFNNGQAACGCAHSGAMRGLAKYLLEKHDAQYTNDQILEELGKWKVLFFPGNMLTKANVLKSKNIELNFINLASNKYRGIETGASTGGASQVGGC